jgi:two-component system, cell cycle sensor histidine kinase and response regulator CckA
MYDTLKNKLFGFFPRNIYENLNDYEWIRKFKLMHYMALTAIMVLIPFGVIAYVKQNFVVAIFDLGASLFLTFCLIYIHKTRNLNFPVYSGIGIMTALYLYLGFSGGVGNSGFLWYYTYPLFTMFILGRKKGSIGILILFIPTAIYMFSMLHSPNAIYSSDTIARFIPSFLTVFGFSYLFEDTREKLYTQLISKQTQLEQSVQALTEKEHELKRAHNELELRIAERTEELKKSNELLSHEIEERRHLDEERKKLEAQLLRAQKMEALGTLAGGVAHDLNNILGGIVSYPDHLLHMIPSDSPLRNQLLTIKTSGERAAAVVQDLLTLARRGVTSKEVLNLNRVALDVIESPEIEKLRTQNPSITFDVNLAPSLLNIEGSYIHLMKTILNLMTNAVEAVTGKGTISISTENKNIVHTTPGFNMLEDGDYVVLTVRDTGMGISQEDIGRIFEPFYTKKKMGQSGTGLGLAVVWGTVKDHNGHIDVKSTEDKGTVFTLYFPATNSALTAAECDQDTPPEHYAGNGEWILAVDDVEEQLHISKTILSQLGYTVETARSGEEAIEKAKQVHFDLVVLDMIMPGGMDGLETFQKIREIVPTQKTIITSGYSESGRVKEAQMLGAGVYIKKPFTTRSLGIAIKRELSKSKNGHIAKQKGI